MIGPSEFPFGRSFPNFVGGPLPAIPSLARHTPGAHWTSWGLILWGCAPVLYMRILFFIGLGFVFGSSTLCHAALLSAAPRGHLTGGGLQEGETERKPGERPKVPYGRG